MELYKQVDKIFNYIIIKNGLYIFDLNLESKSNSADNINILDSDDNTLVIMLIGSLGSLGSYETPGTPPSELKDTELGSNLYLISSSGQLEKLASKVSNITANLGNLGFSKIIIVQMVFTGTIDIPNLLFLASESVPESAQQSESLIRHLTHNNLYRGNYKYSSAVYFIYLYPLSVVVTLS